MSAPSHITKGLIGGASFLQVAKILLRYFLKQGNHEKARVVLGKDWMSTPLLPEEVVNIVCELQVKRLVWLQ